MKTFHSPRVALPTVGLLAVLALSGCSLLSPAAAPSTAVSQAPVAPTVTAAELADTVWDGTDSAGTVTKFTLHANGSTGVKFGATQPYDDPADTWALEGNTLTITIYNIKDEGDATYVGQVSKAEGPVDLALTFTLDTKSRTITITKAAK